MSPKTHACAFFFFALLRRVSVKWTRIGREMRLKYDFMGAERSFNVSSSVRRDEESVATNHLDSKNKLYAGAGHPGSRTIVYYWHATCAL